MNSQFALIQQIYRIISGGNVQDLQSLNLALEEFFNQSKQFAAFSPAEEMNYFYSLYPKLLDRLFGANCTGYQDDDNHFQTNSKWLPGDSYGWLKQLINFSPRQTSGSVSGIPNGNLLYSGMRSPINSASAAQLKQHFFQFFHPFHKLFSLLERTKYELHVGLLPEKLQMILSSHPTVPLLLTDNNLHLLTTLFRLPVTELFKVRKNTDNILEILFFSKTFF
jgi:hypothetical protein